MIGYIKGEDIRHAGVRAVGKNAGLMVIAKPEEMNSRSNSEG